MHKHPQLNPNKCTSKRHQTHVCIIPVPCCFHYYNSEPFPLGNLTLRMLTKSRFPTRRKWQSCFRMTTEMSWGILFIRASCPKSSPSCRVVILPCREKPYTVVFTPVPPTSSYFLYLPNPKCQMAQMLWLPSFFLCFLRPVDTDENKQSIFLVVDNRFTLRWMILSRDPFQMTYVDVSLSPWFIAKGQRKNWSSPWFPCLHPIQIDLLC